MAFAQDGTALLSGSSDTTALVWDLTGRVVAGGSVAEALTPAALDACWADLANPDAARAYQAIRRLAAAPRQGVLYLAQRLRPVPHADEQRIARLIAELDNRQFAVRQKAFKELNQFGERALESYRKALEGHPSLEVRSQLLRLRARYSVNSVPLRTVRTLEALELAGTARAYDVFTRLAHGAPGAWLTEQARAALQRRAAIKQ
ncbi:MAG TPA: hypothetical protein VFA18_05620 [Gemmataceae bacterium]|nr:hypothetical protein [Gemmataceae bacterium]